MTSGVKNIGTSTSPYQYNKTWSGADGKYAGSLLKENNYTMTLAEKRRKPGTGGNNYVILSVSDAPKIWSAADSVKLQNRLLSEAKQHSFNLGVALGEGRQTVDLVKSTLLTLGKAATLVKRGRLLDAADVLSVDLTQPFVNGKPVKRKSITSRQRREALSGLTKLEKRLTTRYLNEKWLELKFGWLPLLQDVHDAAEAYHAIAGKPRRFSVKVSKQLEKTSSSLAPDSVRHNYGTTETRSIRAYFTESLSVPRQLGLTDPLSVAWELLPWSFVIDWFIPIGTYLENLAQLPRLTGTIVTSHLYRGVDVADYVYRSPSQSSLDYVGAKTVYTKVEYTRTVTSSLLAARPGFKPLGKALSPSHLFSALSLTRQRFK